jgi:tetratricopeptide (TPR) repeat protein
MSSISLCVIARDTAPTLSDCIRSADELVDEVIVLDSGRLNGSGDWAVNNGAKMIPYQWTGNVSEARTTLARHATGDWVLVLDADEALAPGSAQAIREALDRGGMDCGFLPLLRECGLERAIASAPRLMRRTVDLHWDEGDGESVSSWIAMRARRVRAVEAPIIKMVADTSEALVPVAQKDETVFEVPSGELFSAPGAAPSAALGSTQAILSADTQPADEITVLLGEAWGHYHGDNLDGAWAAIEEIWGQIESDHEDLIQVATLRAHIKILGGEYREALESIGRVLEWGIHHPNMDMLQGVVAENAAMRSVNYAHHHECLERAEVAFVACTSYTAEISARDSLPGVTSWAANTRLGTVRLARGDVDGARLAFEAALEADPEHAEASLGLMECKLETGGAASIMAPLVEYMEANLADAWMLASAACEELGSVEDALLFTQRANELHENGLQASAHRNFRMADLLAMAGLYVGKALPGPGPWGAIGAIVSRKPLPSLASPQPVDGPKVVRYVTHCVAAGWSDILGTMLEPRADQVVPGISELVRRTLQALGAEAEEQTAQAPVFLGGTWDSGSRTLQGMIDGHSRLEAGEETKLIPIMCSLRNEWWNGMALDLEAAGIGEKQLDGAVKAFIEALISGATPSPDLRSVETTPHTLLHMETMASIFPQARFIHVVRDGRDVVGSLLQRDWMDPSTGEKVWCCQTPKAAAEYWVHVVDAIREQGARIPGRYLEVQYSELIEHPEAVMRSVLAFLGERWEASVLDNIVEQPAVQFENEDMIIKVIEDTPRYIPPDQVSDPDHVVSK